MVPRETGNNVYAKFWRDRQRVLWYFYFNWLNDFENQRVCLCCASGLIIWNLDLVINLVLERFFVSIIILPQNKCFLDLLSFHRLLMRSMK